MSLFRTFFLGNASFAESPVALLTLPVAELPTVDLERWLAPLLGPEATVTFESPRRTGADVLAEVRWGPHAVQLATLPVPVPDDVLARSLELTPWEASFRAYVRSHQRGHWLLRYSGVYTTGVEPYLALYHLLRGFQLLPGPQQPLAVLNEPAFTAHPYAAGLPLGDEGLWETAREIPPVELWTGTVGFDLETGHWLLTQGYRLLGQPELAYFPPPGEDLAAAQNLLHEVFLYRHAHRKPVARGDVLWLDPQGYFELLDGRELEQLTPGTYPIDIVRAVPAEAVEALLAQPPGTQP
ncbi:MAG: hypothetical protein SFY70_08680 [Bacteroidia bacterium]|nr:hypothetical protein [Bacteroidia bacterium]